jgi:cell division protein ZapA
MRTVEVKILGQRYRIKSEDGEEYIQSLAKFVNEQIQEVQKNSSTVSTHNVAILAALNITDVLFKLRGENQQWKKEVRERIKRVVKMIRTSQGNEE